MPVTQTMRAKHLSHALISSFLPAKSAMSALSQLAILQLLPAHVLLAVFGAPTCAGSAAPSCDTSAAYIACTSWQLLAGTGAGAPRSACRSGAPLPRRRAALVIGIRKGASWATLPLAPLLGLRAHSYARARIVPPAMPCPYLAKIRGLQAPAEAAALNSSVTAIWY